MTQRSPRVRARIHRRNRRAHIQHMWALFYNCVSDAVLEHAFSDALFPQLIKKPDPGVINSVCIKVPI